MEYCEVFMDSTEIERRHAIRSLKYKTNSHLGICETLRFIYDLIEDLPEDKRKELLIKRLTDAIIMSKNIVNRLDYYRKKYKDTTGGAYKNLMFLSGSHARKKYREERKKR